MASSGQSSAHRYKPIIKELRQQDWGLSQTTQGHYKAIPPSKEHGIVHFSTSDDSHAFLNTIKALVTRGFIWPAPEKKKLAVERRLRGKVVEEIDWENKPDAAMDLMQYAPVLVTPVAVEVQPTRSEEMDRKTVEKKDDMDKLFTELKDAKALDALNAEYLRECAVRVADAKFALEQAATERAKSADALRAKKAEFDHAFSAEAA